jgi:hypothetical protein
MLNRLRRVAPLIAIVACLAVAIVMEIRQASLPNPSQQSQSEQQREQQSAEKRPNSPTIVVTWLRVFDRHNGSVSAAAAFVIMIFTAVLAVVGRRQAILTRESIDLARAEFVAANRPVLRIRRIAPNLPLLPGNRVNITITVGNVGGTTANIAQVGVDIFVDGTFNAEPRELPGLPAIPAGAQAVMNATGGVRLTEAQIDAIELGTSELLTVGIINYRDDNGVIRSTSFARIYDRPLGRFIKAPEDHPEADREFED